MKSKFFLTILATVLLAGGAQAQYTGNNQTNTISGVSVDWLPDGAYIVGDTYVYDALVIQSGGVLSNAGGYIGFQLGANDNSALVTGSGSVWSNTLGLYVGYSGASDALTITNGGAVFNDNGYIGYQPGASNNTVLVAGSGSVWVNGIGTNILALFVGYGDMGNSLIIANGGAVFSYSGYVGEDISASNNTVLITGSGSVWSNLAILYLGLSSGGNSLTITNGGTLYNGGGKYDFDSYGSPGVGYIGYVFDSNTVLITGSGSVWNNANDLYVGYNGAGNSLTIANGGAMYSLDGYIGADSDSNTVLVTGNGSLWNDALALYIGSNGVGNSLTIANGARVSNGQGYIGHESGADGNTVLVTGNGSVWTNGAILSVGYSGAGNSLTIASNGTVYNTNGFIGYESGADSNTVFVTGNGSVWNNGNELYVGNFGSGNSLVISNGGSVLCADDGLTIGASGGSNNTVVIAGGGSLVVTNEDGDATLFVSEAGGPDSLVLDGGTLTVDYLYLVNGSNSIVTFNAGTLNSGGTFVTTPQNFTVGDGTDAAVFHLLGGEHTFVYGDLEISSNAFLTGCGDINSDVLIDAGGTVLVNCGGTLTFSRSMINSGMIEVVNGSALVADDEVDNYSVIITNGSTKFNGGLVNYYPGCVLGEANLQISSITRSGNDILIQIPAVNYCYYQLQVTSTLKPATWTNLGPSQYVAGGVLTFTDSGGATNRPGRFYRINITLP